MKRENYRFAGITVEITMAREWFPEREYKTPEEVRHITAAQRAAEAGFARAVEVILASGGMPVLAHPLQYRYPQNEVIEMIEYARACGIRALECYYSEHSPEDQAWLLSRAEHYGLGVSGGSDFHGTRKTHIGLGTGMGDLAVPYSVLENLKALRD